MLTARERRAKAASDVEEVIPIPEDAMTEEQAGDSRDSYSFPVVKRFTSWMQYRTDRASSVNAGGTTWLRGEVKRVIRKELADNLAAQGQHAHVPIDTPLGQPEEFRPAAKKAAPEEPTTDSSQPPTDNPDGEE